MARVPTWPSAARHLRRVTVVAAAAMLSGCVATTALKRPGLAAPAPPGTRVLVMPPDVQLSEVTAGGLEEPNARWTQLGRRHVSDALARLVAEHQAATVTYQEPAEGSAAATTHVQLLKLHEAVGGTILVHKYNPAAALPTKPGALDWTLGPDARALREAFGTDYALFVYLHDSYASGGRVAMIVAMAVLGAVVPGGIQRGFASLVDLRSGDIVWFNRLVRESGDLRTAEAADEAVHALLVEFPL